VVFLNAALLGILQGLTEFLPVSSTAHLILGAQALGFDDPGGVFIVMIQLGSILAVVWLYREKVLSVLAGLTSRPEAQRFAALILVAFLPALVIGGLFGGLVKKVLYYSPLAIAVSFIAGGVVMLLVERLRPRPTVHSVEAVPFPRAFGIGLCQALALVPGVSRSGSTIVGGLVMGLERTTAAEFSFFLAMPTMAAAFVHDLIDARHSLTGARAEVIAVGFVMAFLASLVVVKPFLRLVGRSGFAPFAWYRIAAGAILLGLIAAGRL
jgi:undecaprenyl-diphosphatase